MTVTNGTIDFEQRVVDGDFRHRVAKASISFEGESYVTARRIAVQEVRKALGLEPDSQIITPPAMQARPVEAPVPATTSNMEQRHAAEVNMPVSDDIGAPIAGFTPPPKRGRKSAANPPLPIAAGSTALLGENQPVIDATSMPSSENLAPTDVMLQSACQARMIRGMEEQDAEVGNKIRALVAKYVDGQVKIAANIPQDKRMAFLHDLSL